MSSQSPIVVLDSGLGGLTVVRALQAALPSEDLLYFGDTARLPYGSKTAATVTNFVHQIISYLRPHDPRHVVVACNTATALALPEIRAAFPDLSISGVIDPGARAAVAAAGSKQVPVIGVIATEATIRSKAYERAIHARRKYARLLLRPTPLLVPIIEEGRRPDDPLVQLALRQYLQPLMQVGLDVLVLGCTHYPILKDAIAQITGPQVRVIDSAEQCAQDVAQRLGATPELGGRARGSAPEQPTATMSSPPAGTLKTFVTDDPLRFRRLASRFLGTEIEVPTWVCPDDLYRQGPEPSVRLTASA
jgi:glutamate racemase